MSADAKQAALEVLAVETERVARFIELRTAIGGIRSAWERGEITGAQSIEQSFPLTLEMLALVYGPWDGRGWTSGYSSTGTLQ